MERRTAPRDPRHVLPRALSEQALLDEFNERGLVIIHDALSREELAALNAGLDADIAARPAAWPQRSPGTIQSTEVLTPLPGESASVFDPLIRHGSSLPLLRAAYQDDMAFSEVSLRSSSPPPAQAPRAHSAVPAF